MVIWLPLGAPRFQIAGWPIQNDDGRVKQFVHGYSMKQQSRFVRRLEAYCWVVQRRSQDREDGLQR